MRTFWKIAIGVIFAVIIVLTIVLCVVLIPRSSALFETEEDLIEWLATDFEKFSSENYYEATAADWEFMTDITNSTRENLLDVTLKTAIATRQNWEKYIEPLDIEEYESEDLKRQLRFLKVLGDSVLDEKRLEQLISSINSMTSIYNTAWICAYQAPDCLPFRRSLYPEDIQSVMAVSVDYDELLYLWMSWADVSGALMRDDFETYVELSNEAARANGFEDRGDMWRNQFETETFLEDIEKLWEEVEPLYNELHTYVARKLKERYEDRLDISDGLIPAHVFGDLWAESWFNLTSLVRPYPDVEKIDITNLMWQEEYYTIDQYHRANEFYMSLGLENVSISFDENSRAMLGRSRQKEVSCHPTAWNFVNGEDFSLQMCVGMTTQSYKLIHSMVGYIEHYLLYTEQPVTFRRAANPGFYAALGDAVALSAITPKHLQAINLLTEYEDTEETFLNFLMDVALDRIPSLPFGLLVDKWRWDVFSGSASSDKWNEHWWYYRETLQKVKAPVERTEDHFDPGSKFHIAAGQPYISYFIGNIMEFQFYKALCIEAGEYDPETKDPPLYKCDFYNSTEVGDLLKNSLSLGSSRHWSEILEIITGNSKVDTSALLEYFEPLYEFLKEENSLYETENESNSR